VPESPSFLTSLPPELRNHIYSWLFIRDGQSSTPVRVSSTRRSTTLSNMTQRTMMAEARLRKRSSSLENLPTASAYIPNILLTCAQVYHESVGILYHSNTFLISANLHKHNTGMGQISDAATFLHILGSQLSLLTKVMVGLSPLCPE
jgi:hypothetical protein